MTVIVLQRVVQTAMPSVTDLATDTVFELHAHEDAQIRSECWWIACAA